MENPNNYSFIEVYQTYLHHGDGIMLCSRHNEIKKLEYVMFRQENGFKKFIFNEKLLEIYNSLPG